MNLLPPDKRKELRREYVWRFAVLGVSLLAFSFLVASGIVFPKFAGSATNYYLAKRSADELKDKILTDADKKLLSDVDIFKERLTILSPSDTKNVSFMEAIGLVIKEKTSKIHVSSFSYIAANAAGGKLVVSGVSDTREDLMGFADRLRNHEIFSAVDLPVSNFSQRTDIEFSITITINIK